MRHCVIHTSCTNRTQTHLQDITLERILTGSHIVTVPTVHKDKISILERSIMPNPTLPQVIMENCDADLPPHAHGDNENFIPLHGSISPVPLSTTHPSV